MGRLPRDGSAVVVELVEADVVRDVIIASVALSVVRLLIRFLPRALVVRIVAVLRRRWRDGGRSAVVRTAVVRRVFSPLWRVVAILLSRRVLVVRSGVNVRLCRDVRGTCGRPTRGRLVERAARCGGRIQRFPLIAIITSVVLHDGQ